MQFTPASTSTSGDLAYESGTYTETTSLTSTKTTINISGSYLTLYRRTPEGRWLILQQAFTAAPLGPHN
jgi:ketosteroid isomerase-like protein